MPDTVLSLYGRQVALRLEGRLRVTTGQVPEHLDSTTVKSRYPRRPYVHGWRVRVEFSDGNQRRMDVLATAGFPFVPVRTALVDHPPAMTWPHVESDGILCLLPNMAECDPDDPCAVAENLLGRSVRLVEDLLEGAIVERDFREEFLTYWAYETHTKRTNLVSLLTPAPPSRVVRAWRGEGLEVVGEDAQTLARWVRNRFGSNVKTKSEDAAFVWLDKPPLPADYPQMSADLRKLALASGPAAAMPLDQIAVKEPTSLLAVLGATGRGGPGLIAVNVANPKRSGARSRSVADPVSKGFRPGRTPKGILLKRYFGAGQAFRSSVQRADAPWIHGRGRDSRTERLLKSGVVVIGCGSVGAPVACALAQAGVGRLVLIDNDTLDWPNVGRHPLGASAVDSNKAEALAQRLQADFPHLRIEGRNGYLQEFLHGDTELLGDANLTIAATGNWAAESRLNRWHVEQRRANPVLYAWTEPHACAGHAVAIVAQGGCFQCNIGRTGMPSFRVVDWPDDGHGNEEEPSCGAHYNPYGPVELSYVTAMIGDAALDCLLSPPTRSSHRVIAASQRRIDELGGRWSDVWLAEQGVDGSDVGVGTVDRAWPHTECPACGLPPANAEIAAA
ncbi:MAG: ThiF family adenylyltransferase [Gammaproteobacteria bacterium]|nr:ThiF family adenylyltransferase [Gammaproteobacteria bacterium]